MTNEGVLRRWSRRKLAAKAAPAAVEAPLVPEPTPPDPPPPDLPPVETLGLASDYTAFLQKGVTAEVQRLALQRAWESDERIAGFRGMAEYAWDFNAPDYGRLRPGDDVARLLQAVLEPPAPDPPAEEPAIVTSEAPPAVEPGPAESEPAASEFQVAEPGVSTEDMTAPEAGGVRRHGSALPC